MSNVPVRSEQESNSYVLITSDSRQSGESVSNFHTLTEPLAANIQSVVPVSFDGTNLFLNNITTRNNTFVVNAGGPQTLTITPGNYGSGATMAAAILAAFDTAFGPGNFTVTDISQIGTGARFRIATAFPSYQVTSVNTYLYRPTGIKVMSAAAATFDFDYTALSPTAYFDVCAREIHRGISDDASTPVTSGVLFRVNPLRIPYTISDVVTLQQSGKKYLFYPQRTSWPRTNWRLVDEWGLDLICEDGSVWWVSLATCYIQPQSN